MKCKIGDISMNNHGSIWVFCGKSPVFNTYIWEEILCHGITVSYKTETVPPKNWKAIRGNFYTGNNKLSEGEVVFCNILTCKNPLQIRKILGSNDLGAINFIVDVLKNKTL